MLWPAHERPFLFICCLVFDSRRATTKEYWCPKRASSIQYGYNKWGTHARVFSQTPAHGNSKIEIRQSNRGRRGEQLNVERSTTDTKKEVLFSHFVESSRPSLTTVRLEVMSAHSHSLSSMINIYSRDVSDAKISRSADADAYANICA